MKKQILKIGEPLKKEQQKEVFGGSRLEAYEPTICGPNTSCTNDEDCCAGEVCGWVYDYSDWEFDATSWGNQPQTGGSSRICS